MVWKNTSPSSPPIANERSMYVTDSLVFSFCKKEMFIKYIKKIGTIEMNSVEMTAYAS